MTDTTNTPEPPLPEPDGTTWQYDRYGEGREFPSGQYTEQQMRAYGDARAAHAVAQMQGEPVAVPSELRAIFDGLEFDAGAGRISAMALYTRMRDLCLAYTAPATAEQPAETREHILSAHIALSTCDGEGRVDKHHVQIAHEHIEAALGCLAATAPAPEKCEITDAEIDAAKLVEMIGRARRKLATYVSVYPGDKELRGLLAEWDAAIALANGRG